MYESAREKTSAAYQAARQRAHEAYDSTKEGIDSNPGAALIGGIAVGALIAALLPRTRQEDKTLGALGQRIRDTARDAAKAARTEGTRKLDELGLNKETARQKFTELADGARAAAKSSAKAARGTVGGTTTH
ncbi:hypothetical protein [Allosphingosinicella indica]|uniref:hypothetical protein n=1 Tax=Allosphingosinicella indica TaxID=941907 RepID=UPI001561329E|nr:hypothetical protein [Allosphingosinicella indica]